MWVIIPQTVRIEGVEVEVEVKPCRWSPRQNKETGETNFVRGRYWSHRVLVGNTAFPNAEPIQIKLMIDSGTKNDEVRSDTITRLEIQHAPTGIDKPLWDDPFDRIGRHKPKPKGKPKHEREDVQGFVSAGQWEDAIARCFGETNFRGERVDTQESRSLASNIICLLMDSYSQNEAVAAVAA